MTVSLTRFFYNTIGTVTNPYVTFRAIAHEKEKGHALPLFVLCAAYFIFASLLRTGSANPYLLTFRWYALLLAAAVGLVGMTTLLFAAARLVQGKGEWRTVFTLWSYTLLPTLLWFFATSILYLLVPPPRTLSIPGKTLSIVFLSFSIAAACWKLILYYLTLRFGMRLDLYRIGAVTIIITPILVLYALGMYRLGVFRIPFI